jgi:VIT1/CCC1 family predicted Fe2+/Mn2+ transporter
MKKMEKEMSEERVNPLFMGISAIALGIVSVIFWIIHYFITVEPVILIVIIFSCTVFGLILALSFDPRGGEHGIHLLQKIGLIINLAFVGYLIIKSMIDNLVDLFLVLGWV